MIPREFFPNMPDEVFEMWLEPISARYGWPFKSPFDSLVGTEWFDFFGGYDLDVWVFDTWELVEITFSKEIFTFSTTFRINSIINFCIEGIPTFTANVEGTKERFRACADFITANGRIPKPVVGFVKGGEIELVDGYHRIAALLHIGIPVGYKIPIWLPRPNCTQQVTPPDGTNGGGSR